MLNRRERWFLYGRRATVGAGLNLVKESILINTMPTDFLLRGMHLQHNNAFTIRCRDGEGHYFQQIPQHGGNIVISANQPQPLPIYPEIRYRPTRNGGRGTSFLYDIRNISAGSNTYELVLWGAHELPEGYPSPYPARCEEEPYYLSVEFTIQANGRLQVPLAVPQNVAFAIRTMNFAVNQFTGPGTAPANLRMQIRDRFGQSFMNDFINFRIFTAFFGSELPGTPSPELVIPPDETFRLDLSEQAGTGPHEVQITFGGALLYAL